MPNYGEKVSAPGNFMRREFGKPLGVRRFQIDRDTIRELHGAIDLIFLRAGHNLEVEISAILMFAAQDLGGVEEFILRADSAAGDA